MAGKRGPAMHNPRNHYRRRPSHREASPFAVLRKFAATAIIAGLLGYSAIGNLPALLAASASGCEIKGNISMNTGERIFHVPGQEHYSETRISLAHGERWFCSEAEARAAGWRKAFN